MRKYLECYSEPRTGEITSRVGETDAWDHVVVIPALGEGGLLRNALNHLHAASHHSHSRTLVILVLNARDSHPIKWRKLNLWWWRFFLEGDHPTADSTLGKWGNLDVLVLDRFQPPYQFKAKQGVGDARKTGADTALNLIHSGKVQSPWIFCTDADAEVPLDYFHLETKRVLGGLGERPVVYVFPFRHRVQTHTTIRLYERFMDYYVEGLRWAGSPFAFHTLGSTMAIDAAAYASVRGFPKREAAEDFYCLNKLAKIGLVVEGKSELVLSARKSRRVPFGTGASVATLEENKWTPDSYPVYSPRCFYVLKDWLGFLRNWSEDANRFQLPENLETNEIFAKWVEKNKEALNQRSRPSDRLRHLHTQFDAFQTLKLIHQLTDRVYPKVPLSSITPSSSWPTA